MILLLCATGLTWWINCLPNPLFDDPLATELLDRDGQLLSAAIAADGQWRMPAADSVSPRLRAAIITFEDRRFATHPGVDPIAMFRALRANYRAGTIVSGGSTLSMQVIRLARKNPSRNLWQKFLEAAMALRLELSYSKTEILALWLNHAPFGGNVVGVEAASRRYYGRGPDDLSWSEAATLAVLPNSPGLIHPGRNRAALRAKRDALLKDLVTSGDLTPEGLELALLEPLPQHPLPLPRHAPHLLQRMRPSAGRIRSELDADLQREIGALLRSTHLDLAAGGVHNLAVVVSDVRTGNILAYHGNVPGLSATHAPDVDMIVAPRSPGSVLKPILYGLALDAGEVLPGQLLPDIPTHFQSFRPTNFHPSFDGAVPANEALARSLNIPFVFLLQQYGVSRFHAALRMFGFNQLSRPAGHYGLSLILGGGEITMEEIHQWFVGAARQLRDYDGNRQANRPTDYHGISAGATYTVFEALREVNRPDESGAYHRFESSRPVAWKTGTSFGFRDAWAVGATPAFVVTVWAGNADGEGRPGLVGVRAAAPLLFRVFRLLDRFGHNAPNWFEPPYDDLTELTVCTSSGLLAGPYCPSRSVRAPARGERGRACTYHRPVTVTADGSYRTDVSCDPDAITLPYFVLPPVQAHFYRRRHADYRELPPLREDCSPDDPPASAMQIVYPEGTGVLSRTKDWKGTLQPLHFEVAHPDPAATVYWHCDGRYLTTTRTFHQLKVDLPPGEHQLTLVDNRGNRLEQIYRVK
nr:penicillin-binding protein 1C [Lewinella sp. JB7]